MISLEARVRLDRTAYIPHNSVDNRLGYNLTNPQTKPYTLFPQECI
jgi:hypothetical protein